MYAPADSRLRRAFDELLDRIETRDAGPRGAFQKIYNRKREEGGR